MRIDAVVAVRRIVRFVGRLVRIVGSVVVLWNAEPSSEQKGRREMAYERLS